MCLLLRVEKLAGISMLRGGLWKRACRKFISLTTKWETKRLQSHLTPKKQILLKSMCDSVTRGLLLTTVSCRDASNILGIDNIFMTCHISFRCFACTWFQVINKALVLAPVPDASQNQWGSEQMMNGKMHYVTRPATEIWWAAKMRKNHIMN
jgi:hypothetical protein